MKLTKPQRELLHQICEQPCYCAEYYSPAKKLIQLGLAEHIKMQLHPTVKGMERNLQP